MLERKANTNNLPEHDFASRKSRKTEANHPIVVYIDTTEGQKKWELGYSSWHKIMPVLVLWNKHWGKQRFRNQTSSFKSPSDLLTTNHAGNQLRQRHWTTLPLLCKLSTEQLVARRGRGNLIRMRGLGLHSLLLHVDGVGEAASEHKFELLPDNHCRYISCIRASG